MIVWLILVCNKFYVKNDNVKIFVFFCYSGYWIYVIILYVFIWGFNYLKDFFEIYEVIKLVFVVIKFLVYMYYYY